MKLHTWQRPAFYAQAESRWKGSLFSNLQLIQAGVQTLYRLTAESNNNYNILHWVLHSYIALSGASVSFALPSISRS